MRRLEIAPDAERDIDTLLAFSEARFGPRIADRYRLLIRAALNDLLERPDRATTRGAAGLGHDVPPELKVYSLRHSRARVRAADRIAQPRHLVVFRYDDDALQVVRVLHERMDVPVRLSLAP